MTRILRQAGTRRLYHWTALLAERDDMTEEVVPVPSVPEAPEPDSEAPEPLERKRGRPRKERADDAG